MAYTPIAGTNQSDLTPCLAPLPIVVGRAEAWLRAKMETGLPTAFDGKVHFTLFDRCMPPDWLCDPITMLPVMVVVGAWLSGTVISVTEDPKGLTGYKLGETVEFSERFLDLAFARLMPEWHTVMPSSFKGIRDGQHIECMWLLNDNGFFAALNAQGLPIHNIPSKVFGRLPEQFLRNPGIIKHFMQEAETADS